MWHKKSLDQIEAGLYVLATPIGNLRDITLRALDVLSAVDIVAAEDTRVTRHLLAHYGIEAKIVSLREHNEASQSDRLVSQMQEGRSVALVTDAGTPAICDPGAGIVARARVAGIKVWPIPGPSALTCALSVLGWETDSFSFHGFLPAQSAARRRALEALRDMAGSLVFYETPHRIDAALRDLTEVLGPERQCALFRELTKKFEECHQGTLADSNAWLAESDDHRRGEFVVVVAGAVAAHKTPAVDVARILSLLSEKLPLGDAARIASEITGIRRKELYDLALQQRKPQ